MSLYQRLAISLGIVFTIIISLTIWWSGKLHTDTRLQAEQQLHLGLASHLVQDNPLLAEGVYDYSGLENLFHTLMVLGPAFEFYYVDPTGNIITYSAEPGKVKRERIDLQPVRALLNDNPNLPILGDDPRHPQRQKIFSAAPVFKNEQLQGYLYMIIGGEIADSIMAQVSGHQTFREMSVVLISGLLFLLIVLLMLFRVFTRPLAHMRDTINDIENSELGYATPNFDMPRYSGNNEIAQLASAFSAMLGEIQRHYHALQNIDKHRRTLLADLSHDLRTPLANLQGYIETLALRGDTLSYDDRTQFIQVCLKNANNLKRLIDQIFELAYLEGDQVTLQQETFSLGELLYDIKAKFTLKAQARNISLHVKPAEFEHVVQTDIGKLERVLSNLLENAIRHTPKGGDITIAVSEASDNRIKIEIRDTGIGISQHDIAYIFDARYRATNSAKDNDTHAGLGLAISKKLTQLLNTELTVKSELGKGTSFSFELTSMGATQGANAT